MRQTLPSKDLQHTVRFETEVCFKMNILTFVQYKLKLFIFTPKMIQTYHRIVYNINIILEIALYIF